MIQKKLFIKTFGCAMNERDSAHIIAELGAKENYILTDEPKDADLILINTCSVREKPERKLFSEIGIFTKLKKRGAKLGICGCSASAMGESIIKKAPSVDFVLGARNVSKITQILNIPKAVEVATNYDESNYEFALGGGESGIHKFRALINISIGCDKKCAYCIVPHTRGKEISIPLDMIINEVRFRAKRGAKEIILLGQNVNNYGARFSSPHKRVNFTELLREVSKVSGVERIRFVSPHPLHCDDEFIAEFASNPKIAKYIHLPLQSGSSKVLRDMKRGYTKEWFLNRVERFRALAPNVGIGTDIIVAFPTERESDFDETLEVVESAQFDTMYSFIYSPRANTSAFDLPEIPKIVANERLKKLQNLHKKILAQKAKREIGQIHSVMIENHNDKREFEGRSDNGKLVRLKSANPLTIGAIYDTKITHAKNGALFGEIV
ncbi:tRNA (N6-isopentenyl adenosine(37)-C2)-methylthiotransferase MiaB [Helicobacter sp. 23-1045]